jgi:hypothetical protein
MSRLTTLACGSLRAPRRLLPLCLMITAALAAPAIAGAETDAPTTDAPAVAASDIRGVVFEDRNGNGVRDRREPGIAGVRVSNGLDVVATDSRGRYLLPLRSAADEAAGYAIFVVKPATHELPVDVDNVPQFSYMHKPAGTPLGVRGETVRFGGLAPTGPLPASVDFALLPGRKKSQFKVVVSGDTQTYSNNEIGYMRDTLVREIAARNDIEALLIEGDVVGDDLSLYPRFKNVVGGAGVPQFYIPGNHDLDFDVASDDHSFDTFRREWGPEYYSFEIGDVHFVVLDDVRYPCTAQDNADGLHQACANPETNPTYSGNISPEQLTWLANDLALVPKDKLIVLNSHIPIVSFVDQDTARQMVDNQRTLYEVVGCDVDAGTCERPLLAFSGHTHTNESLRPGESFQGWAETLDSGSLAPGRSVARLPFPQIVAGAACGSWWSGDFDSAGVPESLTRFGDPRGYYVIEFDGNTFRDTFKATGKGRDEQMSVDFVTPAFLGWYQALRDWDATNPSASDVPPVTFNDLPDTKQIVQSELDETLLSVNVWNGSLDSQVFVRFDGQPSLAMERTQAGAGEGILETLEPFALKRQMAVARHAYQSTSGNPRAQGIEMYRGNVQGNSPSTPRPIDNGLWATRSTHVWQMALPKSLGLGAHTAEVTTVDLYGRVFTQTVSFEVVERPLDPMNERFFKRQNFQARP